VVRRRFSIVGAYPLARSWRNPGTVTIPQYRFNKTKQHTQLARQLERDNVMYWKTKRKIENDQRANYIIFNKKNLVKMIKQIKKWSILTWSSPPQVPCDGFLQTACACDLRRVTCQVDLTSWLDNLLLVMWDEDRPEARMTSRLDKRNLSSSTWAQNTIVGPWFLIHLSKVRVRKIYTWAKLLKCLWGLTTNPVIVQSLDYYTIADTTPSLFWRIVPT